MSIISLTAATATQRSVSFTNFASAMHANQRPARSRRARTVPVTSPLAPSRHKTTMPPSSAEGLPNVGRLLIVGLGNHTHPGTRHNVGMMAVDYSVGQLLPNPGAWRTSKAIGGWIAETVLDGTSVPGMSEGWARHVLFLKPKTYMNFSGGPVLKALRELDVSPSDIIVLHDDLERKLSGVSVKSSGSANGHNGLRSMIASLKADNFQRVRIGIDRPASKDPSAVGDYVLQRFTEPEMDKLKDVALPAAHATLMNLIRTSKGISG